MTNGLEENAFKNLSNLVLSAETFLECQIPNKMLKVTYTSSAADMENAYLINHLPNVDKGHYFKTYFYQCVLLWHLEIIIMFFCKKWKISQNFIVFLIKYM